jgi:hypothetical protein
MGGGPAGPSSSAAAFMTGSWTSSSTASPIRPELDSLGRRSIRVP